MTPDTSHPDRNHELLADYADVCDIPVLARHARAFLDGRGRSLSAVEVLQDALPSLVEGLQALEDEYGSEFPFGWNLVLYHAVDGIVRHPMNTLPAWRAFLDLPEEERERIEAAARDA